MNKRGEEKLSNKLMFYAFILILVAIIILGVFKFVSNAVDDTTFWRIYYSKDSGMLLSVGQTGRGDFKLTYNTAKAAKPLVFGLKDNTNTVEVYDYDPNNKNPNPTVYYFFGDKKIEVSPALITNAYFNIEITPESLNVTVEPLKKSGCPDIITKLDAGKQAKILVISDNELKEVADNVKVGLGRESNFVVATNEYDSNIDLTLILTKGEDKVMSVYYDHQLSRGKKIGCLIKNNLIKTYPDKISYYNFERVDFDSTYRTLLSKQSVGIVLSLNKLDGIQKQGEAIVKGVEEYYG